MPAARHRVPPHPDRHAVRHGAAPARVTFLHPVALVGLAAAAIPALLHLLERRVPPEAEFPPLRYLSEAERQSARRLKLRHLLLLILRTAVIVLIVLAAARPLFPTQASGGALHEPTALAVIFDNSASSGLVVDGRPVLDRLKAVARGSLARAAASDRLWLVLAEGVARGGTPDALVATVDSAGVSARRLDLTAAVRAAARLVDAEPLPAREVHVVSDLQRTALGPGRAGVPRGVRVLALAPPSQAPANRGVGAVRVTDGAATMPTVAAPASTGGGPFVAAALAVLEEGQRVRPGNEIAIGDRPEAGTLVSIVIPPPEPALIGQANRALAARGGRWRFASEGTPGPIAGPAVPAIGWLQVARRYRIEPLAGGGGGGGGGEGGPGTASGSSV